MRTFLSLASTRATSAAICDVCGLSKLKRSITSSACSRARALNALLRASARTCLVSFCSWPWVCGPKTVPPPRKTGERVEPARARPVPFCFHGFWLPPTTNPRVLVWWLPWRWLARYAFTAWCITGMFTVPSNVLPGSATRSRGVPSAVKAAASKFMVSDIVSPACGRGRSRWSGRRRSRGCRSGCVRHRSSRPGDCPAYAARRRSVRASSCP